MKKTCPPYISGELQGGEKRPLAALQHLPNREVAPQTFPPPATSLTGTNSSASTLVSMDLHVSRPFRHLDKPPPSYHRSFPMLSVSCCEASLLHRDLCCTLPLAEAEDASPPVYPDLPEAIPFTPFRLASALNDTCGTHSRLALPRLASCCTPHIAFTHHHQRPFQLPFQSLRSSHRKSAGSSDSQQILNSVCRVTSHTTRATNADTFHPQHGPYLRAVGHLLVR